MTNQKLGNEQSQLNRRFPLWLMAKSQSHCVHEQFQSISKTDSIDNSQHFQMNLNDKIINIERIIKEDRLFAEQVYVNQMEGIKGQIDIKQNIKADRLFIEQLFMDQLDLIEKRLKTQDEFIKSCEAFFELEATNDSRIQSQFKKLNKNIKSVEDKMKIQSKLLCQLRGITERHNNTVITHFDLNGAYCADLVSNSKSFFDELNNCNDSRSNDKRVKTHKKSNTNPRQATSHQIHSNDTGVNNTQPSDETTSDVTKCVIHTQPLRVKGRSDYQRIRIHVRNGNQYTNETEICNGIGQAVTQFSVDLKPYETFITKLKYEPGTRKLKECTLILLLPKPTNLTQLNRFLSQHGFTTTNK